MIEVNGLVKMYDDHVAVDHLSFVVKKGQVLGFLGPNGAGKSTTMNMLTGYISATEGSITVNGYDLYDEPEEAKKSIGYLPEIPPVYPDMTVREYLRFVAEMKCVPKKERGAQLEDIMARTQITDVADRLIKHLSKGYRQRVGLAQAIMGYPEIIILDEPTVGLDPMQIIEIRELIRSLAEKHTVIISSHILSEISAVCDTVMIINKGKMVVTDKVENLPKHLKGAAGLTLQVKGEQKRIQECLLAIEEVERADCTRGDTGEMVRVSIHSTNNADVREEVFYALAGAHCPIYEMRSESMSLEDIFLEVTKEQQEEEHTSEGENTHSEAGADKSVSAEEPEKIRPEKKAKNQEGKEEE